MGLSLREELITLNLSMLKDKLFWWLNVINLSKFAYNFNASDGEYIVEKLLRHQ